MPAIPSPEAEKAWLDTGAETLEALTYLIPYPTDLMEGFPVTWAVNDPCDERADHH